MDNPVSLQSYIWKGSNKRNHSRDEAKEWSLAQLSSSRLLPPQLISAIKSICILIWAPLTDRVLSSSCESEQQHNYECQLKWVHWKQDAQVLMSLAESAPTDLTDWQSEGGLACLLRLEIANSLIHIGSLFEVYYSFTHHQFAATLSKIRSMAISPSNPLVFPLRLVMVLLLLLMFDLWPLLGNSISLSLIWRRRRLTISGTPPFKVVVSFWFSIEFKNNTLHLSFRHKIISHTVPWNSHRNYTFLFILSLCVIAQYSTIILHSFWLDSFHCRKNI